MFLLHIVFAFILATLLAKAFTRLFAPNHPKVIIITSHNNAILGYKQNYCNEALPKTVLPNGAVVKIVIRCGVATFSLLTEDGDHVKFLKREHMFKVFFTPVPFATPDCIIYLVRHGESEANVGTNYDNPSLTEAGIEDAISAGKAILSDIDGIHNITLVSSPLTRAMHTMDNIKRILHTTQQTILDIRCIESVRDIGRPIHTRGPNTDIGTIIACDPRHPLSVYRISHICDPSIDEASLKNLVVSNRLPPAFDLPGVSSELLLTQLANDDWPRVAALTPLHEVVATYL